MLKGLSFSRNPQRLRVETNIVVIIHLFHFWSDLSNFR
jgi:hypothetical protein